MKCSSRRNCDRICPPAVSTGRAPQGSAVPEGTATSPPAGLRVRVRAASMKCSSRRNCDSWGIIQVGKLQEPQ